jgi:2-polyprenyl-3-methyl-5-hydroxy-6-metoxy-1,4-benzoquinol methylase
MSENIRQILQEENINYADIRSIPSSIIEAINLIPDKEVKVLDVGCGIGSGKAVADKLKRNFKKYVGIEFNKNALEVAKKSITDLIQADIETFDIKQIDEKFDVIMFNDVLEHLVSPDKTLENFLQLLNPDGCIIISVPNARHQSFLLNLLLNGDFLDLGVAVKEHLRFFTLNEIIKLLNSFNLFIDGPITGLSTSPMAEMRAIMKASRPWIRQDFRKALIETEIIQYVFRASFTPSNEINIIQKPNLVLDLNNL